VWSQFDPLPASIFKNTCPSVLFYILNQNKLVYNMNMNRDMIVSNLSNLPLADIKYYESIGSTNEAATNWAKEGAANNSLVVANEQTAGRGRTGRKWITIPDSSLSFSLIFHPLPDESRSIPLFSPLGSLAVAETLVNQYGIKNVSVKWPNDVLINNHKVCGILVETSWMGDKAQVIVVGVGINVGVESTPPPDQVLFPATSIEKEAGVKIDRLELLNQVLKSILAWRTKVTQNEFLEAWDHYLAFRGEWVHVQQSQHWSVTGELIGIDKYGNLRIRTQQGGELSVAFGDVHLRPAPKP
jgi:BirA family transcriptional regulator, biotin operon repressor / biotin---[acetyl-CoA-carboxylase] ligase